MAGSIALQEVAAHTDVLAVGCTRCERTARYQMATLIERHGRSFPVPALLHELSVDCVKRQSVSQYDLCGVHCPEMPGMFIQPVQTVAVAGFSYGCLIRIYRPSD
jgi:hypothetical protein